MARRRKVSVQFAWDIWCVGAFWFGIKSDPIKRLHIFPMPFVVIVVEWIEE
jgi:hypothetical protein